MMDHAHARIHGVQPRENLEILLVLFSKTDSRIEQELRSGEARAFCARHRIAQTGHRVADDIAREGTSLHRLRRSTHVHEDQGNAGAPRDFGQTRVHLQR